MTWLKRLCFATLLACLLPAVHAAADKVIKVLPHYLDLQGRHTLSPSLFERDAYQALLRKDPSKCSGLRFDTQWKARKAAGRTLKLRLELVTTEHPKATPFVLEQTVTPKRWFSSWTGLKLDAAQLKAVGEIIAWRVSLRDGDQTLSEQHSFLW